MSIDGFAYQSTPMREAGQKDRLRELAGGKGVPTRVCRGCGNPVVVIERNIEMNAGPRMSGTVMTVVAQCHAEGCERFFARKVSGMGEAKWVCGKADVTVVDGDPFAMDYLPQPFTERQRTRLSAYLDPPA